MRLLLVRPRNSGVTPTPTLRLWFVARLASYFAAPILAFFWLVALPFRSPWSGIAGRAFLLLLAFNALIGLIGYSTINTALLFARLRRSS
ncbi:hypothetical protein LZ016_01805 [Sphingomonas sp. SM33]|uniref:Uncharacterized protein n=1 Tax=Sphingomonas telluris TaxID=2907998 RepID=A0ABS9VIP5_9SPHN|nr:hypothetical protein [Sphingomonas telluris]MCH8614842.1 hypothetical protein [Sphingomonas telluris]